MTLALGVALTLAIARTIAAESVEPPPDGPVPRVTLDALPLASPSLD
jgi:hypothetical protein